VGLYLQVGQFCDRGALDDIEVVGINEVFLGNFYHHQIPQISNEIVI
jgi:hypothetical protein